MKKLSIVVVSVFLVAVFLIPKEGLSSKKIPPVMYQFLTKLVNLSSYMYDEKAFTSKKHDKTIENNLKDMKELSHELKHHQRLMTPGYEKTADHFIENINRVHTSFSKGNKRYAYRLFRSTLHACSNCHTQESSHNSMSWNFTEFSLPKEDMHRAHFYYTVRGYEQAWTLYIKVIEDYGKGHTNNNYVDASFDKLLTIALRVDRNPEKLRLQLKNLKNTNKLPVYFQDQIALWTAELKNLEKKKGYRFLEKDAQDFDAYIDDLYRSVYPFAKQGRSQKVVMKYATGMMFEFVNNRPKDKTQAMLYWLGVSNFALDQYESSLLGERFLQECIEDYQPTLLSHKCYYALEDQWVIGFSGSSGIHLPMDLEKKLKAYRKKLNIDQPWLN